jgi:hypothetical protein
VIPHEVRRLRQPGHDACVAAVDARCDWKCSIPSIALMPAHRRLFPGSSSRCRNACH